MTNFIVQLEVLKSNCDKVCSLIAYESQFFYGCTLKLATSAPESRTLMCICRFLKFSNNCL